MQLKWFQLDEMEIGLAAWLSARFNARERQARMRNEILRKTWLMGEELE